MTTKRHEDEKHPTPTKPAEPPTKGGAERQPTDDPLASPPFDVHAPNPPSPQGGGGSSEGEK